MTTRLFRVASWISGLHLLLCLACLGFLKATGFNLFTLPSLVRLGPQPQSSFLQEAVFDMTAFISYPVTLLQVRGDALALDCLLLVSNSIIWGILAGTVWCAWQRQIHGVRVAA